MSPSKKPVSAVIIGAGGRGMTYAQFAKEHPDRFQVVGVAEPLPWNRNYMARTYNLPAENVYSDWRELAAIPRFADAVIITTQDAMHVEPAAAFAGLGYHMLLEKPMAPSEEGCRQIIDAVTAGGKLFAVCHVLRYTNYTRMLKQVLDSGAIGELVTMQHLEPVGNWHQAHSFVRGNWRNEQESSFMLLAKSCHDLDWIRYIMGERCQSLSSFGSLKHFRRSEKPAKAGDAVRCLQCSFEPECPYSARKIYLERAAQGVKSWPLDVLTAEPSVATITEALETGPYGRCVYECDNDVVDHQVVNMLFEGGKTATFTMTAFNKGAHRKTRIFGTRGEIYGDGDRIEIFDFLTDSTRVIDTQTASSDASGGGQALGGHGGGDYGLMQAFVEAVAAEDASCILSGPEQSLESHRMVFAAERARLNNTVENL